MKTSTHRIIGINQGVWLGLAAGQGWLLPHATPIELIALGLFVVFGNQAPDKLEYVGFGLWVNKDNRRWCAHRTITHSILLWVLVAAGAGFAWWKGLTFSGLNPALSAEYAYSKHLPVFQHWTGAWLLLFVYALGCLSHIFCDLVWSEQKRKKFRKKRAEGQNVGYQPFPQNGPRDDSPEWPAYLCTLVSLGLATAHFWFK